VGRPKNTRQLDLFGGAPAPKTDQPSPAAPSVEASVVLRGLPVEVAPLRPPPTAVQPAVGIPPDPLNSERSFLALEQNLALMAGAGAGKTHALITLCLHLLGGARSGHAPLTPSQLCLLTFTDKAAGELRSRLRERLDPLATGTARPGSEPELESSFASLGQPFPPRELWRKVRDDLGAATVGTFHSLCVQLLRRAPAGSGIDPHFELLEERDAEALLVDTAERLVLDALEAGDRQLEELTRELGFRGDGRSLVDCLVTVFGKVREEGVAPLDVPLSDPREAQAEFDLAVRELRAQANQARASYSDTQRAQYAPLVEALDALLDGLTLHSFLERFPRMLRVLEEAPNLVRTQKGAADHLKALAWGIPGKREKKIIGLGERYAGWAIVPYERAFLALLGRLQQNHRAELQRRGVLDFSELVISARDLLRDHLPLRAELQARYRALLVDEFQDTNRLQLELVSLLAEAREGAPRPVTDPLPHGDGDARTSQLLELPLQPAFLCAVGDRKQSIYEFRGADVAVFEVLAGRIEREGGVRAHLQSNWRSSPPLLEFFNRFFATLLRAPERPRDYDVAYAEGDDLFAKRPAEAPGPAVDRLLYAPTEDDDAETCRAADADVVARHLASLLESKLPVKPRGDAPWRPLQGGDVAILFRRFTHLETYRQALVRCGVPHRVVRGRGFYGAQEVLDLASLLALLADPDDALSLAAVLRSPLVAISDSALLQLALPEEPDGKGGLRLRRAFARRSGIEGPEGARLDRFAALFPRLRAERDRLGLRTLLEVTLAETGYREALAGAPFGEQALANLDKLLALAERRDRAGRGDCAAFAREVLELADRDPTEAQADVVDAGDPRAVQLLTIHQSKGLEWPVVFVPDLASRRRAVTEQVLFDRQLGLALKPFLREQEISSSPQYRRVAEERGRREEAEYRRVLYVAFTRARERLVLSGAVPRPPASGWRTLDEALAGDARPRTLARRSRSTPTPRSRQRSPAFASAHPPGWSARCCR
jgi:ATP-dependent helicase/nuclease subunit A